MTDHLKISKILILCFAAAAVISAACAWFCTRILTPGTIELKMDAMLEHAGNIKIYYLGKNDPIWTEQKTLESEILPAKQMRTVIFYIPVSKMKSFRLDFQHRNPGTDILKEIRLTGSNIVNGEDLSIQGTCDISGLVKKDSTVTMRAGAWDPHIIFQLPATLKGKKNYDPFLTGIIFALSMMLLCGIICTFRNLQKSGTDGFDIVFTAAVLILLCIPAVKINRAEISVKENRTLAKLPELMSEEGKINTLAGQQFDSWFNDRFFGRDYLVKGYQKINSKINRFARKHMITSSVIEGNNGWYFYALKNSLRNFQNLDIFTEKELKENLENLKKMNEWCKKNNMKFYYLIAPDKNKIYGENLTTLPKVYPDSRSRAALWVDYIRKHSDIKVVFPVDELKKQKDSALLYYKCDTHWNYMGAYYGYRELMKLIKEDFPDLNVFEAAAYNKIKGHNGDLYALAPQMVKPDTNIYLVPSLPPQFLQDTSRQIRYYHLNPSGKYNAFIMRDSFCNGMLPFFYYSFNYVSSSWQFILRQEDVPALKQKNNNIVILEHVERNLTTVAAELQKLSSFFD